MTAVDLEQLQRELDAAGVSVPNGLVTSEGLLENVRTPLGDGSGDLGPLPSEADPVLAAHDATKPTKAVTFEQAEDAERLKLVNERARTDPAYAALAELALKGQQR